MRTTQMGADMHCLLWRHQTSRNRKIQDVIGPQRDPSLQGCPVDEMVENFRCALLSAVSNAASHCHTQPRAQTSQKRSTVIANTCWPYLPPGGMIYIRTGRYCILFSLASCSCVCPVAAAGMESPPVRVGQRLYRWHHCAIQTLLTAPTRTCLLIKSNGIDATCQSGHDCVVA